MKTRIILSIVSLIILTSVLAYPSNLKHYTGVVEYLGIKIEMEYNYWDGEMDGEIHQFVALNLDLSTEEGYLIGNNACLIYEGETYYFEPMDSNEDTPFITGFAPLRIMPETLFTPVDIEIMYHLMEQETDIMTPYMIKLHIESVNDFQTETGELFVTLEDVTE